MDPGIAILLAAFALSATVAHAEDRASAGVFVHTDDDGLTVIHPAASARAQVADGTHAQASWEADVITAATIDVRTSASPRGFEETRHGVSLGVDRELAARFVGAASGTVSLSPDHQAYSGSIGASLEDESRIHTYSARAIVTREIVSRAGDLEAMGGIVTAGISAGWATLLSSVGVFDLSAALERQSGYLESPYRFVPLRSASGQGEVRVPEQVPDVRWRTAIRAQIRQALAPGWFGRAHYRLHADDWGVAGHTVELALSVEPHHAWLVTTHGRFYGQRGASFYEGRYTTMPEVPSLRTLDRELAPGFQLAGGVRVEHEAFELAGAVFRFDLRCEVVRYRYFDTPILRERLAFTAGIGVVATR